MTPIDVTIRCPHAQHLSSIAPTAPSAAADAGERDKHSRYGSSVLPLALETYGRMGRKSMQTVEHLANLTVAVAVTSRFHCPADMIVSMRCDVERALLWHLADVTLLSLGHNSRAWQKKADKEAVQSSALGRSKRF